MSILVIAEHNNAELNAATPEMYWLPVLAAQPLLTPPPKLLA